jgi:hypothetical protein
MKRRRPACGAVGAVPGQSCGRRGAPRESAHTIVAVYQHEPLHSVEIFSDGSGGRFRNSAKTYDRQELDAAAKRLRLQGGVDISVLRPTLIGLLAGPIAEHRFTNGHVVWTRNDLNMAFAFRPHVEGAGTLER